MSATTDVTIAIEVQGAQAKRELNAIGKSAEDAGGGMTRLKKGLDDIGGKTGADARQALGSMQFALGGISQQGSQAINVVGDLAGLIGSPQAGLGLAIATLTGAALVLNDVWTENDRNAAALFRTLRSGADDELQRVSKSILAIRKELADFGKTSVETRRNTIEKERNAVVVSEQSAQKAILFLRERQVEVSANLAAAQKMENIEQTKSLVAAQVAYDDNKLQLLAAEERLRSAREILPAKEEELRLARLALTTEEARAAAEKKREATSLVGPSKSAVAKADGVTGDSDRTDSDSLDAQLDAIERANIARETALADGRAAELEAQRKYDAEMIGLVDARLAEINDLERRAAEDRMQMWGEFGKATFSGAIDATSSYFTTVINANAAKENAARQHSMQGVMEAEEVKRQAFTLSTAAFLQSTGSELVGIGTKQIFEGAGLAALGNPAGAALLGIGGAAIVAGVGMGATGSAMAAQAGSSISAASDRGAALDTARNDRERERAQGTRGVSGRGAAGGSGGDNCAGRGLTINYGVSGPQPDETARAIAANTRRARRRGFDEVTGQRR